MAGLRELYHIVNPSGGGFWPIGCVRAAAQLQISDCEDGMHWQDCCSRMCVGSGSCSSNLEGGRMGDYLALSGEVLGLFPVFCLF